MSEFTQDDLRTVIRATVGVDDSIDLDGDILDMPFAELGYDSLAVLEIANKVEKEYGVSVPDEAIAELETPRQFVGFVNGRRTVPS